MNNDFENEDLKATSSEDPTVDAPAEAPAAETVQPDTPADAPAAETVQPDTPADAPAAEAVQPDTPADAPAAGTVQPDTPAETPAAETVQSDTPAETPAAETVQPDTPAEAPAEAVQPDVSESPTSEPIPKKKKKFPRILFVLIPLVAVLLAAAAAWYIWATNPRVMVDRSIARFVNDVKDEPLFSALEKATNGGQIRVKVSNDEYLTDPLTLDLYTKLGDDAESALKIAYGREYVNVYANNTYVAVAASPLGKTAYGLSVDTLYADFEKSIFYPGSGSDYELPLSEDQLDTLRQICDRLKADKKDVSKDARKFLAKYYKLAKDLLYKHGEMKTATENGNHVVTITLDETALAKYIKAFYKEICADKEFIAFVDENFYGENNVYDLLRFFLGRTGLPQDGSFAKLLEESEDDIEHMCDRLERYNITITLGVTVSGPMHRLRQLDVSVKVNDERVRVTMDLTEKNAMQVTFRFDDDRIIARVARTKTGYEASLRQPDFVDLAAELTLDGENYKLRIKDRRHDNETVTVKGRLIEDKKHYLVSVDSITAQDETVKIGVTLELIADAEMPTITDYKNFLSISEDDFEEMGQSIREWVESLIPDDIIEDDSYYYD